MTVLSSPGFTARTDPAGSAIRLAWTLAQPAGDPFAQRLRILRRERRFPGTVRRGWVPVAAAPGDLTDGTVVYDSAKFATDFDESRSEWMSGTLIKTTRSFRYRGTPRDRMLVRLIRRAVSADGTPLSTTVEIVDREGLEAGTIYYYTVFVGDKGSYSRATQASALATGRYDMGLFAALPQADRVRDTTEPREFTVAREDEGKGQFQRFIETVEAHADMLRGFVADLRTLHDPRRVDARLLPHLAHHIGWKLKDYLDEDAQRGEVMFAPEFYRTVGTAANITAMINRLTGWDAQIREFVRNLVVSVDVTRREPLQGAGFAYADGNMKGTPTAPFLTHRTAARGSVDTTDAEAMYRLRNRLFEDTAAYSYDCGKLQNGQYVRDDRTWYSRDTIGVYIVPDVETEVFVLQAEWERIRAILQEFLPITIRPVFILMPGIVVEEEYNATTMAVEEASDVGVLAQEELWGEGDDEVTDRIPGWKHFYTNDLAHRSVNVAAVDTGSRTWHTALS